MPMPIYAVNYTYTTDEDGRDAVRPEHRAYLRSLHDAGHLLASGPIAASGGQPAGALIVMSTDSPASAESLLDADPFARDGLIAERTVRAWTPVIGQWAETNV